MLKGLYFTSLFLLLTAVGIRANAQVTVAPSQTAQALATRLTGAGVTVLNPVLTCPTVANGIFSVTGSNLPIDSGIVLTTGYAKTVGSSFGIDGGVSSNANVNNHAAGDAQLDALAGSSTLDACSLEFDVIPQADTMKFDYVFGSEEYNSAVCGPYNDAFAFFISGPGITGQQNMALVPGTNIPVTVNSINNGSPSGCSQCSLSNCTSMGAGSPFTAYYINNTGSTITYRGFTTMLTAQHAVTRCQQYHLKLVIADAGNALYDSGVFIRGSSLRAATYSLVAEGGDGQSDLVAKSCADGSFVVSTDQQSSTAQTLTYIVKGTAVAGHDYTPLTGSVTIPAGSSSTTIPVHTLATGPEGTKNLTIVLSSQGCNGVSTIIDSATLNITDAPYAHILTQDTLVCVGAQFPIRVNGDDVSDYTWSPSAGLDNRLAKEPLATPTTTTQYILTSILRDSGCPAIMDTLNVTVHQPATVQAGEDQLICTGTLLQLQASITGTADSYGWTGPDGFTGNQTAVTINNAATPAESGNYIFTASVTGCPDASDTVSVSIGNVIGAPQAVSPVSVCQYDESPVLTAEGTNLKWYTVAAGGESSTTPPTIATEALGTTTYYVTQQEASCESPRVPVDVTVIKCCGDNLFIPDAFTPNGDGHNDVFRILHGPEAKVIQFDIYNRWGQHIYNNLQGEGWNGTLDGRLSDVDTYYYSIILQCLGKQIHRNGTVILVR